MNFRSESIGVDGEESGHVRLVFYFLSNNSFFLDLFFSIFAHNLAIFVIMKVFSGVSLAFKHV